ncbi:hypothetical protein ACJRO7_014321 [Eucalyptus globulus]|uniref:Uncharacterized protein n=1 Tax=Eucalyptus globulus TaxID=34317 RepID=A0ABD3KZR4_EUCGL
MKPPFAPLIHRRQAGRSVGAAEMTTTTATATRQRHAWQRPLHPLQIVGMAVFSFYIFLGLLLGSGAAEITVTTIFSFVVFSVMFLFVWCTAIDPMDKTSYRKKKRGSEAMVLTDFCANSSSSLF